MTTLDTSKVAAELGTDSRTLRKFLRSSASPLQAVGQGARYVMKPEDLPELKDKFDAWRGGRRTPTTNSSSKAPRERKSRAARLTDIERVDPLAEDDLMTRTTLSIADRQRRAGVVCNHTWPHPNVKGLTVKCTNANQKGTRYCRFHQQMTWCGGDEPAPSLCGPSPEDKNSPTGHPYCRYHNGDISEEDFNALLVDNPDAEMLA